MNETERGDTPKRPRVSRRTFLIGTAALAAALGVPALKFMQSALKVTANRGGKPGRLTGAELETIIALLAILVPPRIWPEEPEMKNLVHRATEKRAGVLWEYRAGVALLDERAATVKLKTRFIDLQDHERAVLLDSLMWSFDAPQRTGLLGTVGRLKVTLERAFHSEPERRFRDLVVRDLLARFYSHGDIAWKLAGQSNYPGVAGDPRAYVHAPANRHGTG